MKVIKRGWLRWAAMVVVSAVAFATAIPGNVQAAPSQAGAEKAPQPSPSDGHQLLGAKGHLFDRQSVYAFLAAAKQAEALSDPLQRCLKYPDPPGSHWSPTAVEAYCRYRLYPMMSFDEVSGLLQRGEFDELERRMTALLQDKLTKPEARNNLDRSFETWFRRPDLELRPLLENWKKAKPQSSFAYAASGMSYLAMAAHARGSDYLSKTPDSNLESMDRLLNLADTELRRAVALDARLTPTYLAMIAVGRYGLGDAYLEQTVRTAMRVDPANFAIYDELMWALQPQWGGSLEQMTALGKAALKHAAENPLLLLLPEKELGREMDLGSNDCATPGRFELFSVVFDQVAVVSELMKAGSSAVECNHIEPSVVYYSEALRFNPGDSETRITRANELNDFDESAWAVKEIDGLVRQDSRNARLVFSRGYAYEGLNNYAAAEKDYVAALAMEPGNRDIYAQLAGLYVNDTHDWEKAWKLDERLVELFPNDPYPWLLRAHIQESQPRSGLKDTADYFQAHFDKSPESHQTLLKMRAAQALQEGKARAAVKTPDP